MDRFEAWLQARLSAEGDMSRGRPVPAPRYASIEPTEKRTTIMRALLALAGSKAALAATATVALAAGGITAKAVSTGNPNPLSWGSTVVQQVKTCKSDLQAGQHGIGQCVSAVAKTHGQAVSSEHAHATPSPGEHPSGPPSTPPGRGSHGGPPSPLPGQGGTHPTGPPSGVPAPGEPSPHGH
jgi:hypothetical protein